MGHAFTSLFSTVFIATLSCLIPLSTEAQVTPDGTTSTMVNQDGDDFTIEQGDRINDNLFHSFNNFSIPTGGSAAFNNAGDIANIFSRVTGSNISNIDGLLSAKGAANLYLINPNGIIFGENARLNLGGSFFASTADSLLFEDNLEFSATNPQAPPLLEVNIPIGLNFREEQSGNLTNEGNLAVGSGENLTLLGGKVTSTGSLSTPGGTVQVLGEGVGLLEDASIDVSDDTGGGNVFIGGNFQGRGPLPNAKRTYVSPNANINADALTTGNGGSVIVWADEVTGFYGNISAKGGSFSGNGGLVEVSGKEQLIFRGNVDTSASNGFPGILLLDPTNITIADGTGDEGGDGTNTFAGNNSGEAGSILSTPLSEINDTAPTTIYESELEGLSGDTNVFLQATNNITVNDLSKNELNFYELNFAAGTGLIAFTADADGDGFGNFVMEDTADTINTNGRDISISGWDLNLGSIITWTLDGDGGKIDLRAEDDITTENLRTFSSSWGRDGGSIFLEAGGDISTKNLNTFSSGGGGDGGKIDLRAGGNIETTTLNSVSIQEDSSVGNGGNISLVAEEGNIKTSDINSFSTSSFSNSENGGNIFLEAKKGNIETTNINSFSYASFGVGKGGDISLVAGDNITTNILNSFSSSAFRSSEKGGNIFLKSGGDITTFKLNSSSSSTQGDAGDGGEIVLSARNGNITGLASPFFASFSVSGTATGGEGGDVTLEAKNKITDIEILTLSSESTSGTVRVEGFGDLSLTNTNIITSKQVTISILLPDGDELTRTIDVGGDGQSGDVLINSLGDLTFTKSQIESDTKGSDPAGNVNITSPGLITFNNSKIVSDSSSRGSAGIITVSADKGITFTDSNSEIFAQASAEGKAGSVTVNTPELTLQQGAQISTSTTASGKAGDITLDTPILNLDSGGKVLAFTTGSGGGGTITVNAPKEVNLGIGVQDFESIISVETSGAGKAGDIFLTTPTLTLSDTARITATATATATNTEEGGSISLNASKMDLAGIVGVFAETQGESPAGTLKLQPDNNKPSLDLTLAPGAKISASTSASGDGGNLIVSAREAINITGQGELAVETTGTGAAGNIELTTQKLTLSDGVKISASTSAGAGGTIEVTANTFDAMDGAKLLTTTSGESNAGSITLNVSDNISLAGDNTEFLANTTKESKGNGGSISIAPRTAINPRTVIIRDGASIAVNSQGDGTGGDIEMRAGSLTLENEAEISAATASVKGGNINLTIAEDIILRNNSLISATALENADGGNVTINAEDGFILAFTNQNNDIIANAQQGNGGNIDITTQAIFGLEERPSTPPNQTNDIDASSEFGLQGDFSLNTPEVDPTTGLIELPEAVGDASDQISQNPCEQGIGSEFTITGKGGIPPNPHEALSSDKIRVGLVDPVSSRQEDLQIGRQGAEIRVVENNIRPENPTAEALPAMGWIFNDKGEVMLTSYKTTDTEIKRSPQQNSNSCPAF